MTTAQRLIEQADVCIKAGRYQDLIPLYEQLEFQVHHSLRTYRPLPVTHTVDAEQRTYIYGLF